MKSRTIHHIVTQGGSELQLDLPSIKVGDYIGDGRKRLKIMKKLGQGSNAQVYLVETDRGE